MNPQNASGSLNELMDVEPKRGRSPDMFVTYARLLNSRLERAVVHAKNKYPTLKFDFDWVSLTVKMMDVMLVLYYVYGLMYEYVCSIQ